MDSLLFLAHRLPWPANKGDKVRSHNMLRHLAERYRVHVGTFVDDPADAPHVEALRSFAASVHDVGMVHVGDEISGTAGTLTPDGRETLERHPEMGAELLRPLETMGAVRDVILGHHEWWDGTGYPRGLAGSAIPVGSRILAVVDAWESMTVGRAHRPARSNEQALEELRRLAGRQFDPEVVAAFEDALADAEHENDAASTMDAAATPHAGR